MVLCFFVVFNTSKYSLFYQPSISSANKLLNDQIIFKQMFKYSKNESLIHQTITKTNIQTCNKLTFECSKKQTFKNKHSNVQPLNLSHSRTATLRLTATAASRASAVRPPPLRALCGPGPPSPRERRAATVASRAPCGHRGHHRLASAVQPPRPLPPRER